MTMQIRRAERKKAKLRLGISAPSGAGKTYGALQLAFGLGKKIGMIDTEHGSGDLYADLGEYDIVGLEAPYTVAKYLAAIGAFEQGGYDVIIIDSLTHAWAGDGGLLDKQGKIADSSKSGNSYMAWRQVTPDHNALVDAMLQSKCHIIATMRSKTEYVLEDDGKGGKRPKKVGMAPIQRDGMEYEFTVMLDIDTNHNASASKDRTSLLDGQYFRLDKQLGGKLLAWLDSGKEEPSVFATTEERQKFIDDCVSSYEGVADEDGLRRLAEKNKPIKEALLASKNSEDIKALEFVRKAHGNAMTTIKATQRKVANDQGSAGGNYAVKL